MAFIIGVIVQLVCIVIVLDVAMSWLIAFEIVNKDNEAAKNLTSQLKKITDPLYKPIRKFVPPIGGIDLTPLVALIGVQLIGGILIRLTASIFF
ncbi:MAG: YggT family protein [Alcanivorax sp.]